jgi:hypothetical protein
MPAPKVSEQEFIDLWEKLGSATLVAKHLDSSAPAVSRRRAAIERRREIKLKAFNSQNHNYPNGWRPMPSQKALLRWDIPDGIVLVGSDAHYWPGVISVAHRAFVNFAKNMRPMAMILNGDMLDGARVSRHARIGWEHRPPLEEELATVKERIGEIKAAAPGAMRAYCLGNHDARVENKIANTMPELEGVYGSRLKDHFPDWAPCWGVFINNNTVVTHRWKGGVHAPYNNVMRAGVSYVTGHLHSAHVRPYSDMTGTRYGVDTGTMATPYGEQFINYTEGHPVDWRESFGVLTYRNGRLMQPELVMRCGENAVEFRGQVIEV